MNLDFFYFSPYSASLSGGNLVDGLPRALHTEAVGGPHGGFGPAAIGALDPRKLKFERFVAAGEEIKVLQSLQIFIST